MLSFRCVSPLIDACLKIDSAGYGNTNVLTIQIQNVSSTEFMLQNRTGFTFHDHADVVTIKPGEKKTVQIRTVQRLSAVDLRFEVLNAVYAPNKHPSVVLKTVVR